ncbi:MAG: phage holin family protein [Anaerolineales bacterium]|jgi:putative membrane protein|uniref:phage holin family protein n=1 Tax=Candidatus Villigracilis vicinus TaxID=3140679 RepID=UPI003134C499|nr:phage holin family protein [Anaerolineales bacterium]MBK9779593.1 phage holin family protein [Anaerolineales bacterium]
MTKFIIRWVINAVALYAAVWIIPGIDYLGNWTGILWLALIIGLLNALVRPLLKFLTCPLIILTLGLFTLVINTAMLLLTSNIGQSLGIPLTVDGFWSALLGSLVMSAVSIVMSVIFRDELKGKHN